MKKLPYKFFFVNSEKCIGCNLCEYACSLEKAGEINPLKSRIRVMRMHPFINLAVVCKLCENPACVAACPRGALVQSEETRVIRVDNKKCDGCGLCLEACPYGAIQYDEDTDAVVVCDLCDGKPACKEICPVEAIDFSASDEEIKKAWISAYKKWTEESRKFIRLAEKRELDVFNESTATIEKVDEKMRQLLKKQQTQRSRNKI